MKKKAYIGLTIILSLVLLSYTYTNDKYFLIAKNLDIFATLFKEVNAHYVDEVDPAELVSVGIESMLETLDPYTNYIPEEEMDQFRTMTTGQYAGIGVLVGNINGKVKVTRIYPGYSAEREGVLVGDEIISIAGEEVVGGSIPSIGHLLRGQPSSEVEMIIRRGTRGELVQVTLQRENIIVGNVPYYGMINPYIGYIKLEDFAVGAGREVKEALNDLKSKGARSLVLDLRGNGGGLLSEAVNVSNLFIEKGKPVVSTKGRIKDWNKTYKALNSPTDTEIPLAVMIDNESASAAEIVAGVIQDYDRGILIGRSTFGKGLVQTTRPLAYNAQLKVTTAKYYIPSGRCIQAINYNGEGSATYSESERVAFKTENGRTFFDGSGLTPDIEVEEQLYSALARKLSYEGYLFDYAIIFSEKYPHNGDIRDLVISDDQYGEFIAWIEDRNILYKTNMEGYIDDMMEVAKEELYFEQLSSEFESLHSSILERKDQDLINFKSEIKQLLENEVAGICKNYSGQIEFSFKTDPDISKALELLADNTAYRQILGF